MLTLDSARQELNKRASLREERREAQRQQLLSNIRNKEWTVAPDGELVTTSLAQQLGNPLSSAEVIRRLGRCNRSLVFEVANADATKMGVYVVESRPDETGMVRTIKRFVCGMERGFAPERSVRHMTKERVPDPDHKGQWLMVDTFTKETRGWRTVLNRLLKERLITQPQIDRNFPPDGGISRNWQRLTT